MILVLSGTKDGREIAKNLNNTGFDIIVSTVTDYGENLNDNDIKVHRGALNEDGLIEFIKNNNIDTVVDATHPFAINASINAIDACKKTKIRYIRYERQSIIDKNAIIANGFKEAADKCVEFNIIFLTIGSKNLEYFVSLNKEKKLYIRVLPKTQSLKNVMI